MAKYIYQYPDWPAFTWQDSAIHPTFGEVRNLQGSVIGKLSTLGFSAKAEAALSTLTHDVVKTSEIEGERLDHEHVRSSIARRLGLNQGGLPSNQNVEGIVEVVLDAAQNSMQPISNNRLFGWHAALFPTGYSGSHKIEVGCYRSGEMQIVSGVMGKERIHFEAVPAKDVQQEMDIFLNWLNSSITIDPVIKAAIAHFWFIIIHPFDDGNGRIARAISDLLLARADGIQERYYSMSSQILIERNAYYAVLQKVQHSNLDITPWLQWFFQCLKNALLTSEITLQKVLRKADFWRIHENTLLNTRQRLMVNKLLDGFDGKLKTSKWSKIAKCSSDTALRDIQDLLKKHILSKEAASGRSTNYELANF